MSSRGRGSIFRDKLSENFQNRHKISFPLQGTKVTDVEKHGSTFYSRPYGKIGCKKTSNIFLGEMNYYIRNQVESYVGDKYSDSTHSIHEAASSGEIKDQPTNIGIEIRYEPKKSLTTVTTAAKTLPEDKSDVIKYVKSAKSRSVKPKRRQKNKT